MGSSALKHHLSETHAHPLECPWACAVPSDSRLSILEHGRAIDHSSLNSATLQLHAHMHMMAVIAITPGLLPPPFTFGD